MDALGKWILKFRSWLAIGVVITTCLALLSARWLEFDDQPHELFHRANAAADQLEQLFEDFGPDDDQLVLVVDGQPLFAPESIAAIQRISHDLKQLDCVVDVYGITQVRRKGSRVIPLLPPDPRPEDSAETEREALSNPLVVGQFLSRDAKMLLILVQLKNPGSPMSEIERMVTQIHEAAKQAAVPAGLSVRLAGHQAIRVDLLNKTRSERILFAVLSAVVSAAISLVMFRRVSAILICVAGPAIGVIWMMGLLGLFGERINVLGTIVPAMLYVIGFTDSTHLMASFRQARGRGLEPSAAALFALNEVGWACALTFFSTFVAFGSMYLAELEVIQHLGLVCAVGTVVTYVSVVVVNVLLMSSPLGANAGWTIVHDDHLSAATSTSPEAAPIQKRSISDRWTDAMLAYPRLVALSAIVSTIVLAYLTAKLEPDIRFTESLPEKSETRLVIEQCDQKFGGSLPMHVVVEWPERLNVASPELFRVLGEIHAELKSTGYTAEPFSIGSIAAALSTLGPWKREFELLPSSATKRIVRTDLRRLLVTAKVPDAGAAPLEPAFQQIEKKLMQLEEQHPGFSMHLTGTSVVAARNVNFLISDLARSLSATAAIVILIMAFAFRSLTLGLLAIIPNLMPLLVTGGFLQLSGQSLGIASVMTFDLCLGIAVDATIHFVMRFRREKIATGDTRLAIVRTLSHAGGAMILTSTVLVGGFSVLALSQLPPLRMFALFSSGTLACALLCDLTVLPALVYLADRGFWRTR
jgi:uncharacterized protein